MELIKESIKEAPLFTRWWVKKQVEMVTKDLNIGEKIIGFATPTGQVDALLFVTNKRVILKDFHKITYTIRDIQIKNIISFNIDNKLIYSDIEIRSANDNVRIKKVSSQMAMKLQKLVSNLMNEN